MRGAASFSPPKIFSRPTSRSVFLGTTLTGAAGAVGTKAAAAVALGVKAGALTLIGVVLGVKLGAPKEGVNAGAVVEG